MMENILSQKVTPLLKCIVLFLFIFTAKVLTSRPQESQEIKSIHHLKPSHYVRTFTKYHHRRTIQWKNNNLQDISNYWPVTQDQLKGKKSLEKSDLHVEQDQNGGIKRRSATKDYWVNLRIGKRSVDVQNSQEYVAPQDLTRIDSLTSNVVKDNIVKSLDKNDISSNNKEGNNEIKKYNVKAAIVMTEAPITQGPTISCLYKIHNRVAMSATPSYIDDEKAQLVVENERFVVPGRISETTMKNGETVQVEQCTDSKATCYTLLYQDKDGNNTILGQGCWRSAQNGGRTTCGMCTKAKLIPRTKFCCCTNSFCNAEFMSLKEEPVTMKAESTMPSTKRVSYVNIVSATLALVGILVFTVIIRQLYCKTVHLNKEESTPGDDVEKGDTDGSDPEALATGLSCVDNLTLIEHVGQGRFGSVWRGTLGSGSTPVAVKLYSNAHTWQREAEVYALPNLAHSNILRYYGSDTRPTLTEGGRDHLIVVELCSLTLRARLENAPLSWLEFAHLAHGLSSALAHLHTPNGAKPCVVHRDVNSNNVLVTASGDARLADLGLAQLLHARTENCAPTRITEAGTLRYLSPEALEGALDLSGARAALCAVDVFALALVLWEMLWRTRGAHAGATPPYAPPYHHNGLPRDPTLRHMQSLVSRNKARPPLPKGPTQQARALRIATETCDECWDHDAEARLTAVCVEERMAELKQMLQGKGPTIHDNNLHPHILPDAAILSPPEPEKNSNCTTTQNCDVTTPLLYPQPHIGRNACIERNTHTATHQHTDELIHKSLKDITAPPETSRAQNIDENCLSVARATNARIVMQENAGLPDVRSYQRPLEYVPNDVSAMDVDRDRGPKQTNILQDVKVERPKWGIRKFFDKLNKNKLETEVKLTENSQRTMTSIIDKPSNINERPTNLTINQEISAFNFEGPCTLSPPNKTLSAAMMLESENKVLGFKELPFRENDPRTPSQIFAVIVPKFKPPELYVEVNNRASFEGLNKGSANTSISSQSMLKANSESEDSTGKKRLSSDNRILNSGISSRASINLEMQYIDNQATYNGNMSPFEINSDCSSSEDEHLMLLSENGGSKITMQTIPKAEMDKCKYQNEVLKESSQTKTDFTYNKFQNKYKSFDNEFSDPNDKENVVNGYSGDNPVYLAALNGEIDTADLKLVHSPKPILKNLAIKRQHSLEHVSDIFASAGDINLLNPAGRVKTPGDLPVAVRRARRDRALQKGRANDCNRLSLYDDRMMFGNSL